MTPLSHLSDLIEVRLTALHVDHSLLDQGHEDLCRALANHRFEDWMSVLRLIISSPRSHSGSTHVLLFFTIL